MLKRLLRNAAGARPTTLARSAIALATVLASCRPDTADPTHSPLRRHAVAFVEITFDGIGTSHMRASAVVATSLAELVSRRRDRSLGPSYDLTLPQRTDGGGDATIQLEPTSTSAFTVAASATAPATRYLQATFGVRNAQRTDSVAFDTPRHNLTFVAVATPATIRETAVSVLQLANGAAADPSLALQVAPTGAAVADAQGTVTATSADVLQILSEAEAAAIRAPSDVTGVFPYGFVVRSASSGTSRTLAASPAAGQFDGKLTVAYRIPVQSNPAADPTRISVILLALDDSETRVTQSLEEQAIAVRDATRDAASALSATEVTLLPGGSLPNQSGLRTVCAVRIGGSAATPTAFMVDVASQLTAVSPDPYAANGEGSFVSPTAALTATFSAPVTGATPVTFIVRGLESGIAFSGRTYHGNGTATIATPAGQFAPGEEVEFVATSALSCPRSQVGRLRIAAAAGPANFATTDEIVTAVGGEPVSMAIADFNGDHVLDVAVANSANADSTVSVLLGRGDGTFAAQRKFTTQRTTVTVVAGDLNGDGNVDLVAAALDGDVDVLLGNGDGTFQPRQTYRALNKPEDVALGDLNGDGSLDLVVTNSRDDVVAVLLGNGDGTFGPARTFAALADPRPIVMGDVNGDGVLDLVTASSTQTIVAVLLGNGDGTFQAPITVATSTTGQSLAIGDLNRDGRLDVVCGGFNPNELQVLLGNGDGTFRTGQIISAGSGSRSIAIGDINGDGKLDLAVAINSNANVVAILGNGDGTFGTPQPSRVNTDGWSVRMVDLNGDARLDLVVVNNQRDNISVFLNGAATAARQPRRLASPP